MYFGSRLYLSKSDPYHGFQILFTSPADAAVFKHEHSWLERIFIVKRTANVVELEPIMDGYEPICWLQLKEKRDIDVYPF